MNDNHPHLTRVSNISPIWIVPLLALLIAGWLALRSWQERGPEIQIVFDDAAGIAVGKTKVKFRDVVVGEVIETRLSSNFEKVTVFVEMDPQVAPLLSESTRFWVVAPRISLGGVSGLDTLLSGVYLEMDPGEPGAKQRVFDGLTEPPSIRSYQQGTQYTLRSEQLGSLDIGSLVYHRQVPVGEVTRFKLLPEAGRVETRIFIKAPYDELIMTNTTFWNVSGLSFEFGSEGLVADVESFAALMSGGLAFSTPPDISGEHARAEAGAQFHLFDDREAVAEGALTYSYPYLLKFVASVRGLSVGAPVEFRGIQVGKVEHVGLDAGIASDREIDVVISIQPERINPDDAPTLAELNELFATLVAEGMRAQLKTRSFLTGSLYVDLLPEHERKFKGELAPLTQQGDFLLLPTADSEYSRIARRLGDIAQNIAELPFDSIGKNLDSSLHEVATMMGDLNKARIVDDVDELIGGLNGSAQSLDKAIDGMRDTIHSIDSVVAPDSALQHRLTEMLEDVSDAADSLENLTDELARYPDSLIRGKNDK
ncbi:MAG: intermembrane transport protein PqiB [Pseudomonadales bacterium]